MTLYDMTWEEGSLQRDAPLYFDEQTSRKDLTILRIGLDNLLTEIDQANQN